MTLWPPTNLRYMESVIKEVTEKELTPTNMSKEDDLFLSWQGKQFPYSRTERTKPHVNI
jgi:hypothetical protein